uniref:Uncharacterized protein n=1 Tax=Anguilla anguilla TaxID=7936 RepID=A0A0E9T123_ANGAN
MASGISCSLPVFTFAQTLQNIASKDGFCVPPLPGFGVNIQRACVYSQSPWGPVSID